MTRKFIDRCEELKKIMRALKSNNFELIIVYGRRRVGKTTLLKKIVKKGIYFLCSKRNVKYNLKRFSEKVCDYIKIPITQFKSFQDAFNALLSKEQDAIIVIDEFGYLVEKDIGILSDFQEIIDESLKNTKVKLILCGSYVTVMGTRVLGSGSPLYGRNTLQLKIKPLSFKHLFNWFKGISFENALKIYGVTSAVPKYLEFFKGKNVENEIITSFFDSSSFLYNDAMNLLSEELRDYSTYVQVLEAIALGYTRITEIGNYSFVNAKDVYFYLSVLRGLGVVERIIPLLADRKSKRGIYRVRDNYFRFWFEFVSPFQAEVESYNTERVIMNFKKKFNQYLGKVFEDLVLEFVKSGVVFQGLDEAGKWWSKDTEIDVIALNKRNKKILFAECKWRENVNAENITKELFEKAKHVHWHNNERNEVYAVFAKSFRKRITAFKGRKVCCYDLKDLMRLLKK